MIEYEWFVSGAFGLLVGFATFVLLWRAFMRPPR